MESDEWEKIQDHDAVKLIELSSHDFLFLVGLFLTKYLDHSLLLAGGGGIQWLGGALEPGKPVGDKKMSHILLKVYNST